MRALKDKTVVKIVNQGAKRLCFRSKHSRERINFCPKHLLSLYFCKTNNYVLFFVLQIFYVFSLLKFYCLKSSNNIHKISSGNGTQYIPLFFSSLIQLNFKSFLTQGPQPLFPLPLLSLIHI